MAFRRDLSRAMVVFVLFGSLGQSQRHPRGYERNLSPWKEEETWVDEDVQRVVKRRMESILSSVEQEMKKKYRDDGCESSGILESKEIHNQKMKVRARLDSRVPEKPRSGKPVLVFVTGPESTGNRYTVKLFIEAAGCYGKSDHTQPLDHKGKGTRKDWSALDANVLSHWIKGGKAICAVLHRSYPHNNHFVDMARMARVAREKGFEPRVIVLERYLPAAIDSQIQRKHVPTEAKAREHIKRAYLEIYDDIIEANLYYTQVDYESLKHPWYIEWLFREMGIRYNPKHIPAFIEANAKHLLGNVP